MNFEISFFSNRCPSPIPPKGKIATWFNANGNKWAGAPYWECRFTNKGNEVGVMKSITFHMCSCNSGGEQFAVYPSGTATADGAKFECICELSINGGGYSSYESEQASIPMTGPNITAGPSTTNPWGTGFGPKNEVTFNFEEVPGVNKGGTIDVRLKINNTVNNPNYSGSHFISTKKKDEVIVPVIEPPEPTDPDPETIVIGDADKTITDKNIISTSDDIWKNYRCTFGVTISPSNAVIRNPSIGHSGGTSGLVNTSFNGSTITCTAANSNTDYSAYETFRLSADGGASASFTVRFHNKPTAKVSLSRKKLNIRTASSYRFERDFNSGDHVEISVGNIWLTSENGSTLTKSQKTFENNATSMNIASHTSNGLKFLSLVSNSKNIFKVDREHVPNKIKFKVWNTEVQNVNPENAYASTQIIDNVYWSISPKDISQLSFDWMFGSIVMASVDVRNSEASDVTFKNGFDNLPSTVVIGISGDEFPFIGNLRYENDDSSDTAGYCRGIRIEYMYSKNESENSVANSGRAFYYDKMSSSQAPISMEGRVVLDSRNAENINKFRDLYIRITPYFYFGSARNTNTTEAGSISEDNRRYFGDSFTLPQKFVYMTDSDFYTPFLFPTVRATAPYTSMMLPQIERSGHLISKSLVDYRDVSNKMDFGIRIADKEIVMRKNPEYFSSTVPQPHVIVDIGYATKDFSETSPSVSTSSTVYQPFIDLYDDEEYQVRKEYTDTIVIADTGIAGNTNRTLPTLIRLDTSLTSMWDLTNETPLLGIRPTVNKGELIFYHDYENFQTFIDKYRNLIPDGAINGESFTINKVSKGKTGNVINTEFWSEIARRISLYSESMQNWATASSKLSWVKTKFTIPKGTVIDNLNPLASLFQNFWVLLTKCNGHENQAFATHKYLHDMGFTHESLSIFTHKQISNKEGL